MQPQSASWWLRALYYCSISLFSQLEALLFSQGCDLPSRYTNAERSSLAVKVAETLPGVGKNENGAPEEWKWRDVLVLQ
jgi:hypothetical protein